MFQEFVPQDMELSHRPHQFPYSHSMMKELQFLY